MLCRLLCVLLFIAWTAELPSEIMYAGVWQSPFASLNVLFDSIPGLGLTYWQVLLLLLAPASLLRPRAFQKRTAMIDGVIVVSVVSVVITLLWGLAQGGSAYGAYYQLWRFLLALLVALIVHSIVRSARDLKWLGYTLLAAAIIRGTLAMYFYWAYVHGKMEPPPEYLTSHSDSVIFVGAVLLMISWGLARARWTTWMAVALVTGHVLYAIVLNDRRIAWVSLLAGGATIYILIPRGATRRLVNRAALLSCPLVLVYVAVGWGRPEKVFEPLSSLTSVGSDEDPSSLARQEETRNLLYTFYQAKNPVFGTGWGVPYQKQTSVYANYGANWTLYLYLPHNSLLGLVVFSGLVGLFGIWMVVPVAACAATRAYRSAGRPTEKAAAMFALAILPVYSSQCFGDVGLQSLTSALVLGVAMGVAGAVPGIGQAALTAVEERGNRVRVPMGRIRAEGSQPSRHAGR